jgi:pimeloyl-ACP methyl ester carboxylesterase
VNPLFFGNSDRRLFGIFSPGRAGGGKRAVVICPPWGSEYLSAHRSLRVLSDMLAAAGVHVLRFDYYGTGDSAGDLGDVDLQGWMGDIELAVEELKDTTMAPSIGLLGLRLGATLAAAVAGKRKKDINALALWDPVVFGTEYLSELRQAIPISSNQDAADERGFLVTENVASELRTMRLPDLLEKVPSRTIIVTSYDCPAYGALTDLREQPPVLVERVLAQSAWIEEGHSGAAVIPILVIRHLVQWLTA